MNRIRVEKNRNYTTISNIFLKDKNLSLKAKGFLAFVMSLPDNWDFTVAGVVDYLKEGRDAVYRCINELKQMGYCRIEPKREKGKFVDTTYTFYESPEEEMSEKPYTENPYAVNPNTENTEQINTNIINTNIINTKNNILSKESVVSVENDQSEKERCIFPSLPFDDKTSENESNACVNLTQLEADQLNDEKKKVKRKKSSGGKRKKTVSPDTLLHSEAKAVFLERFKTLFDEDYYWTGKDAGNLKYLLDKIKYALREKGESDDNKNVIESFKVFLSLANDSFILKNYTIATLNGQYNAIKIKHKAKNGVGVILTSKHIENKENFWS